jgi:hypothetical protein
MRQHHRFPLGTVGAVVAAACVAVVLQIPLGMPQPAARPDPAAAAPQTPPMEVNRALKGDRLRAMKRPDGAEPFDVQVPDAPNRPLPDGCESAFGPINPSTKPSRCVT